MEKDSYDIYYCLRYYPGGPDRLAAEFLPDLNNMMVQEALATIAQKFTSPLHVGPAHVADFEDITGSEERLRVQRDAYDGCRES